MATAGALAFGTVGAARTAAGVFEPCQEQSSRGPGRPGTGVEYYGFAASTKSVRKVSRYRPRNPGARAAVPALSEWRHWERIGPLYFSIHCAKLWRGVTL